MLSTETIDGVLIVRVLERRLDASKAPSFKEHMSASLGGDVNRLVLDLGQVEFIDSSGLGVIVSVLKRLGPSGSLAIASANSAVRRLFSLTRMDRVFTLYDTPQLAIENLQA
ncbi:anti-sigma B factor antagonist [Devosia lucknowensis]|uniref:Anti-sigma factor antagonist n=1 Tax=Devosia lucknowensis TaxID=1096929 RepID=A0A1Y6GCJ8_9HYPH|nr:STAS domain-containing protein [Devosia lucknowensis]SMQ85510.1 anti-sigma B factor antagonist [Devosia lucknowensis]